MYRWSLVNDLRYEHDLPIVEGFDYVLRVGERHPVIVVGECLYGYRIHMASVTKRNPRLRDELVHEVLKRACRRRGLEYGQHFGGGEQDQKRARDFDNNLAANFMESVVDLRAAGRVGEAIRTGLACLRLAPLDPHYYKALAYAVVPTSVRRFLRPSERHLDP